MRRAHVAAASGGLALLGSLAGCTLGPDFQRPEAPVATRYTAAPQPTQSTTRGADVQSFPEQRSAARWWEAYQSPTLNGWVDEALAHNPDLASAKATLQGAEELLRAQIGASELPSAGLSAQVAHERALGLPDFGPPTSIYKLYAGVIEINYDLDLFGGIRRNNEAGTASLQMQAFELQAARQTLAANVVTTAIRSAALKKEVAATERLVELGRAQENLTRQRYLLGAVPHRDALDAMHLYRTTAAGLPVLRAQWARSRHALAVLLGRTPENAPEDLDFDDLALPASIPVSVPSELVHDRPDILASEASLHAATARVGVATANLFPQINLTGNWGSETFRRSEFLRSPSTVWGIAAGLTQPLFAGGALFAEKAAASDDLLAARERYRATVLKAFQNVADALRTLDEDASVKAERDGAEEAARKFYEETRHRQELGAQTTLAVVASEESWQQERVGRIESAATRLVDSAALFQAIGAPEH